LYDPAQNPFLPRDFQGPSTPEPKDSNFSTGPSEWETDARARVGIVYCWDYNGV